MARPSNYENNVKPFINDIKEWILKGATDKEIASALGIAASTLCEYKNKYPEFSEAFARGRANIVIKIKAALLKKALGFEYEEKEAVKKGDDITSVKVFKRYCPPSETAAAMLLRNYTDEWQDRDNITTQLKKQEQELRTAIAKSNNFDLEIKE